MDNRNVLDESNYLYCFFNKDFFEDDNQYDRASLLRALGLDPNVRDYYFVLSVHGEKVLTSKITSVMIDENTEIHAYRLSEDGVLTIDEDIDRVAELGKNTSEVEVSHTSLRSLIIHSNKPITFNSGVLYDSDIEKISVTCPQYIIISRNCFRTCSELKEVEFICTDDTFAKIAIDDFAFCSDSSLERISCSASKSVNLGNRTFEGCTSLKYFEMVSKTIFLDDETFSLCSSLESLTLPIVGVIGKDTFLNCDSSMRLSVSNINNLLPIFNSDFEDAFSGLTIEVGSATISDLKKFSPYSHFVFKDLSINDFSEESIRSLKDIFVSYTSNHFEKIHVGSFELSTSIVDYIHSQIEKEDISIFEIITHFTYSREVKHVISRMAMLRGVDQNFLEKLIHSYNAETIQSNFDLFRELSGEDYDLSKLSFLFVNSPFLLEYDFSTILNNIQLLRSKSNVSDDDIKVCFFHDLAFSIDLDDKDSIMKYLKQYISQNDRLPVALNSLFFESTDEKIVDMVDRITYVTMMNLTGIERDSYLYKDSIDIIRSVDDESFNSIFGDYKDHSSFIHERIPYLDGIKTLVYRKLKGYVLQEDSENILFDQLFLPILEDLNDSYYSTGIIDYYEKIFSYLMDDNKENLKRRKNIICGRALYSLLSDIKNLKQGEVFSEELVRDFLINFEHNSEIYDLQNNLFINHLPEVNDREVIEMMLRIDPYSFDMFRNYSSEEDIPIKEQLDAVMRHDVKTMEEAISRRYLLSPYYAVNDLIIGYDDLRYYGLAKSCGYRFTKEEDEYYLRKIDEYNEQIDALLKDPNYQEFYSQLQSSRLSASYDKPDIMRVFYEYLQNEVVPSNIPFNKRHDFEARVKYLVNDFIDDEAKEGTRLSKIIYSVDMLYRNNNPSILFKSTEEIVERPILISNPDISDIEKVGIALIALNKMAHEQVDDFIPSEFLTRYRYNGNEVMNENKNFAKGIIDAFTILGNYGDIEEIYSSVFKDNDHSVLKNSRFFDYIDQVDFSISYEKIIFLDLEDEKANSIFQFVNAHIDDFQKIFGGKNLKNVSKEVLDFYRENANYVDYLLKNYVDSNTNPLSLTVEEKKTIRKNFDKWVEHYQDEQDYDDQRELTDFDFLRIFRSLKKVRDGIRENPDVVHHLVDNAVSQRNMYDLKQQFSMILVQQIIVELSNIDSNESTDILQAIVHLSKEQKIEMFKNSGVVIEIHEDSMNPEQDALVIYSKNVRESYSVHLTRKVVNDQTRKMNNANRLLINSQLDNKNLTFNDQDFSFDFTGKEIQFDTCFITGDLGRANAILMNFLNVDLPALLQKYGLSQDVLKDVLLHNIEINSNNLDQFIHPDVLASLRNNFSDDNVIAIIINRHVSMISQMISQLRNNGEFHIPDDMELDEEYAYLKNLSFQNIPSKYIPSLMGKLGVDLIKYSPEFSDGFKWMMEQYNDILSNPTHPMYLDTLKRLMSDLSTPLNKDLSVGTKYYYYHIGDDSITYEINSNKAFKELNRLNKVIDMQLVQDESFIQTIHGYILRVIYKNLNSFKKVPDKLTYLHSIIHDIRENESFIDSKVNLSISHMNPVLKDLLLQEISSIRNEIDPKQELAEMLQDTQDHSSGVISSEIKM